MTDPSEKQVPNSHSQDISGQVQLGVAVSGDVHGNIYHTQHIHSIPQPIIDPVEAARRLAELPLDRIPDPAPLPSGSRMPLSPNPLFVGRKQDLKDIATALKAGTTSVIAAATGMGGVGKTQLASEFAHRYGHYFLGGVFWLSFAEADSIEVEIAACGAAMNLPAFAGLEFPDQVSRVRQLWQEATPRLLIFDNCEDEQLLRDYRPTAGGCRVLVTSRRQYWDVALGIYQQPLDTLPRAQSIDLLRKFRPDLSEDDPDLDALAHMLGDLPLALHVAGSYLKRYSVSVSPAQYLEKLGSSPLQAFALRAGSPTPTQHERDLALTLAASYQGLDANDPTDTLALAILARAAYFAPGESIPRDLLQATLDLSDLPEDEQSLAFDDALIRLMELGLIDPIENSALRLHRLIAAFILSVTTDETVQSAIEVVLIEEGNKRVESGYPTQLQPILAHLRHIQHLADPRGDHRAGDLATILGRAEQMLVNYAQAELLLKRALAISKQTLGENHADTAASLNNLAFLHFLKGDYNSAKQLYEKTVANLERNFGPNHANTAASVTSLANLHLHQGNFPTAKRLLERTLAISKKVYNPNHPNIATNLNILAGVLKSEGNYKAAEKLFKQSLTIREEVLGPKHPDTATSLNNLANSYKDLRKYAAAKPLYKRAIAIREEVLGPNHPETASSLNNLAVLYRELHDYDAAKPLFERALSIYEQVLGSNHTKTAYGLNNLAAMHQEQGDYQAAQLLFERTLTIYTQTLGPNHPNTAIVLNNIAKLLKNQGNYQAAKPLYERSIAIYEQAFGPDHPHMRLFRSNLQELLKILGQ
jgi:tetratricopeptide (TPR) repeat protein